MNTMILVVDNDTAIRQLLTDVLHDDGYSVVTAARAQSALRLLEHTQPNLALIDLGLPDLDGLTLGQNIRTCIPKLPMVFMSASIAHSYLPTGGLFLAKPFDLDELLQMVAHALHRPIPFHDNGNAGSGFVGQ